MIQVVIENFQSIDKISLTIDGFTALVGRSNIGKSAVVRALKCALTGASGTDFIRHNPKTCNKILRGTKKCSCTCSVQMDFEDGPKLLWEKGEGVNRYTAWKDGEKRIYDSVGRNPQLPDFVEQQFAPVKLGSTQDILQVSDQFDPLFLLSLPGTAVADTLSDLGQLETTNKAMSLVARDRKAAASERKIREADLTEVKSSLRLYEGLDSSLALARKVQADYTQALTLAENLSQVARFLREAAESLNVVRAMKLALKPELPVFGSLEGVSGEWSRVCHFLNDLIPKVAALKQLSGVKSLVVPDSNVLDTEFSILRQVLRWTILFEHLENGLNTTPIQELPDLTTIRTKGEEFSTITRWVLSWRGLVTAYKSMHTAVEGSALPDTSNLEEASQRYLKVTHLSSQLGALEDQLKALDSALIASQAEETVVLAELKDLGLCPTCSLPINPSDRILS